jgi:hypothetical protein
MPRPYQQAGLVIFKGGGTDSTIVRALQTDLRALGYLRSGIDGDFGNRTADAVSALTWDLLHNAGAGAPVAIADFNRGRVATKTDRVDQPLAACIADLMTSAQVPKLPSSDRPDEENRAALAAVAASPSRVAPTPFMLAMVQQESSGRHFAVPNGGNTDAFIVVGLDRNDSGDSDHITSRGYGLGQSTIHHHPPSEREIAEFMLDAVANMQHAYGHFREKFDHNVVARPPAPRGNGADDRHAERPLRPLTLCKYAPNDPRYMRDCQRCAAATTLVNITRGTPCYPGASFGYQPTQYYLSATYNDVPNRAEFPCDWPYAARRYNGGGVNSFHYQCRILKNLLAQTPVAWS